MSKAQAFRLDAGSISDTAKCEAEKLGGLNSQSMRDTARLVRAGSKGRTHMGYLFDTGGNTVFWP